MKIGEVVITCNQCDVMITIPPKKSVQEFQQAFNFCIRDHRKTCSGYGDYQLRQKNARLISESIIKRLFKSRG